MTAWNLSDNSIKKLVDLPETGMGFQLVSALWRGESAVLIVLNAELAFDLSQVELLPGTEGEGAQGGFGTALDGNLTLTLGAGEGLATSSTLDVSQVTVLACGPG